MKVWLGFHPSIGIVIYDPARQADAETSQVRLWNLNAQEFALFDRNKVRAKLRSFKSHLIAARLEPFLSMHGIGGQVAKRYLANRPPPPSLYSDTPYLEPAFAAADFDSEDNLRIEEIMEDQDAWARSEEEGWFYDA